MAGPNVGPACPGCGAPVYSPFCPRCGARTSVAGLGGAAVPADQPGQPGSPAAGDALTVPTRPVGVPPQPPLPVPAVLPVLPVLRAGEVPLGGPAQAWSQLPDQGEAAPQTGLFPGWTGMYPAVATAGAGGVLAPRPERRRRALYAVLAIAAATALMLLAAILIAPRWNSGPGVADKDGQPVLVSTSALTATPTTSASSSTGPSSTGSSTGPSTTGSSSAARTVTVTATTGTAATGTALTRPAVTGTATTGTAATGTRVAPAPTHPAAPGPAAPNQSTRVPRPALAPPTYPLGVPQRNIACSSGWVVQLASEFDTAAFTARVAALRAAGQVPGNALAADAAQSCQIFTSQHNTLVLYAGPYPSKYAGCAARLAGPADAFIKGGNPGNAHEYVSCVCPADPAALPQYTAIGQQGVWIGELQRVLGNRLTISVGDLTGSWGVYTPGTRAAVEKFQLSVHLPTTGAVDARTWAALQSAEC